MPDWHLVKYAPLSGMQSGSAFVKTSAGPVHLDDLLYMVIVIMLFWVAAAASANCAMTNTRTASERGMVSPKA